MATITCSSQTILAQFMLILFTVLCLQANCSKAQSRQLPKNEVDALKEVADQLGIGKSDWNFSLNPCDGSWDSFQSPYYRRIFCNCSFPGSVCHVQTIYVQGHHLAGVLPPSLAKLQYLKTIDFSWNYLSGTIPREWLSGNLEYLDVTVNRLSGPIPNYLGSMKTLRSVSLENNMFNGTVPAALGKLANLKILILNANSLTGVLPVELYNLTNLIYIGLSRNNFTGKLPDLHRWENLQILELQASGFEGPIPSSISTLKNLTELIISDLNGSASDFPWLADMKNMEILMLRSCNLSGKIPDYLAAMTELEHLDLSFNNLEGGVPNLEGNQNLKVMYLTGNSISGTFPEWIKKKHYKFAIDLSYNNFSENSVPETCRDTLNLYRSFDGRNPSELAKCLKGCSEDYYSVHINCGGGATKVGNRYFEADEESIGPAKFVHTYDQNWGASNTGNFWDIDGIANSYTANNVYTANNISVLSTNDSELYMTARLSALSLTYYARCLANGNYTVTLHFAEIVLRDDRPFRSLGRRMFDIYIQDERKLKDFDIENEAHGVDKVVKQTFKAVAKNGTLEIRLQYAGKGSTVVPKSGTYGPLISAISVESELRGLDLRTGLFTYRQIRAATDDFSSANKIGEGGFGAVYKGILLDGTVIAVKQLSPKSRQGNREFVNEIGMISAIHHPNVVRLYGCCIEGNQLLLIYEYMENNSLAHALFGWGTRQLELDWPTRQNICVGIAKGLAFLHDESTLKIVHRDIKATNILLDKELNPKISDFGLAKIDEEENTHISTRVAGTM